MTVILNSKSRFREKAAERLYLGHLKEEEDGNHDEATRKLRAAVALGEPMAMHALAYQLAHATCPDFEEVLKLYKQAARLGFAPSAWNLARHYELTQDKRSYCQWLKVAASLGDPDAKRERRAPFPYTLKKANSLARDGQTLEALTLYRRAARAGNVQAQIGLADLYVQISSDRYGRSAVNCYKRAIENGSGQAAYRLSRYYLMKGDAARERAYLLLASGMGHRRSTRTLRARFA